MARYIWTLFPIIYSYTCESSNILLLTVPAYSHCLEVSSIGHELASRGHAVSIVLGSSFQHNDCHKRSFDGRTRIQEIFFHDNPNLPSMEELDQTFEDQIASNQGFSWTEYLSDITVRTYSFCKNILNNTEITKLEKQNFDLIIVDSKLGIMMYCLFLIPFKLKVPYVASSTVFPDFMTGRPFLPSIIPSPHSDYSDDMTFLGRLQNTAHEVLFHLLSMYSIPMEVVGDISPGLTRSAVVELASKAELYLFNIDVILSYPVPRMPNHEFVGGLVTRPAQPLTGEFAHVYNQITEDIVLVTFGSTFDSLSATVEANLLNALKMIKAVVVWKYCRNEQDGNVQISSWVPQNDLLGHPKTKLFVSHCGQNGLFEAMYHGVPILCTPIFGDQFFNAARVKHWEVGTVLPLMKSSEDEIFSTISHMLNNSLFSTNMRKASKMFHNARLNPRQRAAEAIESVIKFGGAHLRSRASDMSTFVFMSYDIVVFFTVTICTTTFVLLKMIHVLLSHFWTPAWNSKSKMHED